MTNLTLLTTTLAATTLMTLFSYVTAGLLKQPYKKPFLLAALLSYFNMNNNRMNRMLGWLMHYTIGFLFVLVFDFLLKAGILTATWKSALLFGTVMGIIGVTVWHTMFDLSKEKRHMDYKRYYIQLFLAHLLFAFVMVICFSFR